MQVGKWGKSLAVRLPASVVEALGLKEGDEVKIEAADGALKVAPDRSRQEALDRLAALKWELPADWRFDREEANKRRED